MGTMTQDVRVLDKHLRKGFPDLSEAQTALFRKARSSQPMETTGYLESETGFGDSVLLLKETVRGGRRKECGDDVSLVTTDGLWLSGCSQGPEMEAFCYLGLGNFGKVHWIIDFVSLS